MNANGNIESLARNGNLGAGNEPMDQLTYAYKLGTNQLTSVSDEVPAPRYDNDIDSQVGDNYDYDEIGNLTADAQGKV